MMTKIPREKRMQSKAFLVGGSLVARSSGSGMKSIMRSEEILKTALVIRWCRAAEHCSIYDISF